MGGNGGGVVTLIKGSTRGGGAISDMLFRRYPRQYPTIEKGINRCLKKDLKSRGSPKRITETFFKIDGRLGDYD